MTTSKAQAVPSLPWVCAQPEVWCVSAPLGRGEDRCALMGAHRCGVGGASSHLHHVKYDPVLLCEWTKKHAKLLNIFHKADVGSPPTDC